MGESKARLSAERVRQIYDETIVVDGSIAPKMDETQLRRMKESGITAFNWTVCSPQDDMPTALLKIADALEFIAAHEADLCLVRSTADIEAAKQQRKIGLIFGPQNAKPAEADLRLFRVLHELGIRIIQLTYNERNAYGDGATEPANGGLSRLGREAVAEVNRLGILIDLSHCGFRTTLDVIEASSQPIAITHSNSYAVYPSARNKTDETIKAMAARGGVIGMTLWTPMVGRDDGGYPTLDDWLRHVDHVANLIGPEQMAIGTDHSDGKDRAYWELRFSRTGKYSSVTAHLGSWFAYDTRFVKDVTSCVMTPSLAPALASLGFSEAELRGILGGNFMRLFRQVWGK